MDCVKLVLEANRQMSEEETKSSKVIKEEFVELTI